MLVNTSFRPNATESMIIPSKLPAHLQAVLIAFSAFLSALLFIRGDITADSTRWCILAGLTVFSAACVFMTRKKGGR